MPPFKPGSSTPSCPDMHHYNIVTQVGAFPAAIGCRRSNHTLGSMSEFFEMGRLTRKSDNSKFCKADEAGHTPR
ncbi:hypothetical protein F5Y05DRAFT_392236 [Hypoxylon sp. FL0543]|nr:hypothetical protein F5Y05DRAFT_392236 [Hypoxylon sp. FL0543]